MSDNQQTKLAEFFKFIENAPADETIIAMDCNDHCEKLASLAEDVANGANLEDVLPELKEHMQYWDDCREEFLALVAVLKAEQETTLRDALNDMDAAD